MKMELVEADAVIKEYNEMEEEINFLDKFSWKHNETVDGDFLTAFTSCENSNPSFSINASNKSRGVCFRKALITIDSSSVIFGE